MITDTHKWQMLALTVLVGGLLYLLAPVLTPFAIAALFAYLGDPLVDRLEARKMSRTWAVSLVFLLITLFWVLVLLILVPILERQISGLISRAPEYLSYVQEAILPRIEGLLGVQLDRIEGASVVGALKQHWQQAGGVAAAVLGGLSKSGLAVIAWTANLLLLPVLIFYLLRDWDVLVQRVRELLPRSVEPTVVRLTGEADVVLGAFLRGQLSVMFALGTIYSLGLWLVGIEFSLLIGMLAGLVSFIPYLGAIVGVGVGLVAAMVQHGDILHVVLVLAVFGAGQTIESFLLTPWLVGDKIGLHPVAVIFAIMAGGQLFGFFGVLLALPVAAVAMVLLRYAHQRYTTSSLYSHTSLARRHGVPDAGDPAAPDDRPDSQTGGSAAAGAIEAAPAPPLAVDDGKPAQGGAQPPSAAPAAADASKRATPTKGKRRKGKP
ncbi:AI-2E family transporter [Pseudomarimonas arenosa]|uniref:AI-2E family transporter n=1 Tax=Pseudomarimonas arenosa TaxID=2774145 RepID=A0AAW3ZVP4_9GAMM|nr:AI-2E family transporter [Pseudomarimonas arenosa]MBD8528126.1 AI-2E family transporter [Pseudomarimonas arenosa]